MKRKWLLPACLIACGVAVVAMGLVDAQTIRRADTFYNGVVQRTQINQWRYARDVYGDGAVTSDDTLPDPNGQTWEACNGSYALLNQSGNTVSLALYGYGDGTGDGDPNGGSCTCTVYLVEPYCSWELIAQFTVAFGELEMTHNPVTAAEINGGGLDPNESYKFADAFTDSLSDSDIWPTTVNYKQRDNGIARLTFDSLGAQGIIVLITDLSGVTSVTPIIKER